MPNYFPGKKVFGVAAIAVVLLVWTFVSQNPLKEILSDLGSSIATATAHAENQYIDSDNDGLSDWEENLLGSDIHNADSNGNGVDDKEELLREKKYQNVDAVSIAEQYGLEGAREAGIDPTNLTQTLINKATVDQISLAGQPVSDQTQIDIVKGLSEEIGNVVRPNIFTAADIRINKSASMSDLDTYLFQFLQFINSYEEIYTIDPLELTTHWTDVNEKENIAELKKLQRSYEKLAREIITLEVPIELAGHHLALANNFFNNTTALEDLQFFSIDPIKSMVAAASYTQYRAERRILLVDFTKTFSNLVNHR